MSEENVEMVRRGFEAFNHGDFDAMMANFSEDIEWRLIEGFAGSCRGGFRGRAGVRRFFDDLMQSLRRNRSEMEAVSRQTIESLVSVRTLGAGTASGAPVTMRWGSLTQEIIERLLSRLPHWAAHLSRCPYRAEQRLI